MNRAAPMREELPDCVRCLAPTPGDQAVRFVYRGRAYEVPLCDQHVMQIDRDFKTWARVARELTADQQRPAQPPPQPDSSPDSKPHPGRDRHMKVVFPVVRGEVINLDAPAEPPRQPRRPRPDPAPVDPSSPLPDWFFTDHARERMKERKVSQGAVWRTLRSAETVVYPQKDGAVKYVGPEAVVVVNDLDQVILTVGYAHGKNPEFSNKGE